MIPIPWRRDRVFWTIFALAAFLGVAYNAVLMLGFGPDEGRHMNYVRLLWDEHRLPFILPDGKEYADAHSLHPPLYYVLLAPFYGLFHTALGENVWHGERLLSMALCLATLPMIYQLAWRAAGAGAGAGANANEARPVARLATAHAALLPAFGMAYGTVNNDSLALFSSVLFMWILTFRSPSRDFKSLLIVGLAFALGASSKATLLIGNAAALLAFFWASDGARFARKLATYRTAAVVFLTTSLLAGPWYVRNFLLYGKFVPIASGYTISALPKPSLGYLVMLLHPNFPTVFLVAMWGIFYSAWSQKDWIPETIRQSLYLALAFYCLAATCGQIRARIAKKRLPIISSTRSEAELTSSRVARWSSYSTLAATWGACLFTALFVHWGWAEGGRYLLPALPGLAIFLALGWRDWLGAARLGFLSVAWIAAMLALNAVCLYWLVTYLNPTFGPKS